MDPTLTVDEKFSPKTRPGPAAGDAVTALMLVWSREESHRVGEVALVPGGVPNAEMTLGRGRSIGAAVPRASFVRQRPGQTRASGPLAARTISRDQLRIFTDGQGLLWVENKGRGDLRVNGIEATTPIQLTLGALIELSNRLLLLCGNRPGTLPNLRFVESKKRLHHFGEADDQGMVGESPAAWVLRDRVAFVAARKSHVIVRGDSGTGKELVAQALHGLSDRAPHTLVSRNAATIPEGLAAAELFGNAKNYPNPGMPERRGLVGAANRSTLFLDEFAELNEALQAQLLRVLDNGEYHRLGESSARTTDFRLLAATNRPDDHLKHDVLARLKLRIEVPSLNDRREDVPLIANFMLNAIAREDPASVAPYEIDEKTGAAMMSPALVTALVQHDYTTNVRELEMLLWQSIANSEGDCLDVWPGFPPERNQSQVTRFNTGSQTPAGEATDPASLSPEEIQACLDKHNGRQEPVCRELGLSSRYVLIRLVKKYGLTTRRSKS